MEGQASVVNFDDGAEYAAKELGWADDQRVCYMQGLNARNPVLERAPLPDEPGRVGWIRQSIHLFVRVQRQLQRQAN